MSSLGCFTKSLVLIRHPFVEFLVPYESTACAMLRRPLDRDPSRGRSVVNNAFFLVAAVPYCCHRLRCLSTSFAVNKHHQDSRFSTGRSLLPL